MAELENIAILGSTLLFILYGITLIFCLIRTARLHKFSPDWKPSKGFYASVLVQCFFRTFCFLLILVLSSDLMSTTVVFLLLSIPDSMFIVSYILLLWQVLLAFISAHTNTQTSMALFHKLFKINRYDTTSSYVTFALTVWIGTQFSLYIIVANGIIHHQNISKEVGICNFSLAASTIIGMITLQIRYSGVPLRSESWKAKLNRINIVTGFWALARILQGILDILDQTKSTSLSQQMSKSETSSLGSGEAAYLFSALIVTEIVCILMVLDYAFMGIFVFNEEPVKKTVVLREISLESSVSLLDQSIQLRVNMKEVCILSQISPDRKLLGKVYKAVYNTRSVFVRKITFSRLSTYVLEDFSEELDTYYSNHPSILPLIGVALELPIIYTIFPLVEPGSLYKIIHIEKKQIPFKIKLKILKQIANAMGHMHDIGKTHGHLSSHNILINQSNKVFITDFGMNTIKKYAGIVFEYCNKSAWSSPEVLKDRKLTAVRTKNSDDVYSFAVITWELFSYLEPWIGLDLAEIREKVTENGLRPDIPYDLNNEVHELIENCWAEDPDERLSFPEILNKLSKIVE